MILLGHETGFTESQELADEHEGVEDAGEKLLL